MEKKKNIFEFLAQVFVVFGITVAVLNVFSLLFGESAQGYSAIFALGNRGIPLEITAQFFCVSVLIAFFRSLFFTDTFIKRMSIALRTVLMVISSIAVIVGFIVCFDWFPANTAKPWIMFFACFGVCFVLSFGVTLLKERLENRQMEEALKKLKEEGEKENGIHG